MSRFISNIPISRRLAWAFLLAALIPGLAILAQSFTFSNIQTERSQAVQTSINSLKATTAAETYLQDMSVSLNLAYQDQYVSNSVILQGQTQGIIKNIRTDATQFNDTARQYQQSYQVATSPQMQDIRNILLTDNPDTLLPNKQQQSITMVLDQLWPDYRNAQDRVLQSIAVNAPKAQVNALLDQARQKYIPLQSEWAQIAQIAEDMSNGVAQVGPSQMNPVLTSAIIIFLSTVVIISIIGFVIRRTITHPLIELATLTKRIAKGETNARAFIAGRDEIHIVANSMNNMLDNIVRLIQETQSQRDTLQAQVEKLVSEVSGVGEGDLRVHAEVTADALGVLADSFNYMVEEFGSLVVRVKMVAREVEESTTMTSDRMNELVETADRQIQQIANAAMEIESMAMTSQQVASRALALASSAREARVSAQGGRLAVQQTVEGMGRIYLNVQETSSKVQTLGERSREINNIVEAISNIAHQTNRLALDAAIQAAMAGENGKGFGAVAADIRRLAERAKEQATSVGRIVRSVRDDIGAVAISMRDTERETSAGSKLAEEAGTSLESIVAVIERQADEIEGINQMALQQQQSSGEVVQMMQSVSETTQENTGSTREAALNMERVARLAEQLLASVEAFKLRENLNYFAPTAGFSADDTRENQLTATGSLRTVTSTAQPISSGGVQHTPLGGGLPTHFPQYSPVLSTSGNAGGNAQLFLPTSSGQPPFPPLNPTGEPLSFPSQTNGLFSAQGNGDGTPAPSPRNPNSGTPSWPSPY